MSFKTFLVIILVISQIIACRFGEINTQSILNEGNGTTDNIPSIVVPADKGRDLWQKPDLVIQSLGDISRKTIADIGAGTGYFAFRLAFKAEKVIAIEIDTNAINEINKSIERLPENYKGRIETRVGKEHDPLLFENEVDLVIIINTVAYIDDLKAYVKTLKRGLKPEGQLMIVDYKMKNLPINAPPKSERIYLDKVEDLLAESGYSDIYTDDTSLDFQYILTAKNNK